MKKMILTILACLLLAGQATGVTYVPHIFYDTHDADSGRFVIYDQITGDSIAWGTLSELTFTNDGGAKWSDTVNISPDHPILVWGYVKEGTAPAITTAITTYTVDIVTLAVLDSVNAALDSVNTALDSLQAQDDWISSSFTSVTDIENSILDTLQSQDDWVGNVRYSHADSTLALAGLHIRASGDDSAIVAMGSGDGIGLFASGGVDAPGGKFLGGTTSRHGLECWGLAPSAAGLYAHGSNTGSASGAYFVAGTGGNAHGLQLSGAGTGNGLYAAAGLTGTGLVAIGGATSGHGVNFLAQAGNYQGLRIEGHGSSHGVVSIGGATGHGAYFAGGSTSGNAFYLTTTSGNGFGYNVNGLDDAAEQLTDIIDSLNALLDSIQAGFASRSVIGDTINRAASILTASDNIGVNFSDISGTLDAAEIGGDAITAAKIAADAIGASEIAADAIGSSEMATTAGDEIADEVWDEDTTGHKTAPQYGYEVLQSGSGSSEWSEAEVDSVLAALTDAAMRAKIWTDTANVTGELEELLKVAGDSNYWASIDDVWRNRDTVNIDSSVIGIWLANNLGITTGLGINLDDVTGTLDASEIGTDAIGSAELATTAVNEISGATADAVWNEDSTGHNTASSYSLIVKEIVADLNAVLDTLQLIDDWAAHQTTVDSIYAIADSLLDTLLIVQDSTESYDDWVASLDPVDVWNIAFGTAFTGGSMGDSLSTTAYVQGSASGLTANDVALAVWNLSFATAFNAGSMGDSVNNSSYVQGSAAGLTGQEVADSVWNKAFTTAFTAGSMGDSLSTTAYVQGSASGLTAAEVADTLTGRGTSLYSDAWWHELATRADSGTVASIWTQQQIDSVLAAITDAAIGTKVWVDHLTRTLTAFGFSVSLAAGEPTSVAESTYVAFTDGSNEDQFKATVSGLSTFDPATDKVVLVDSSAYDISYVANNPSAYMAVLTGLYQSGDSVIVDMSSFNESLDDDTTLVSFLRLAAAGGSSLTAAEIMDSLLNLGVSDTTDASLWSYLVRTVDAINSNAFDPTTDSVLLANLAQIAIQVSDSTLNDSTSYQGAASGLTAAAAAAATVDSILAIVAADTSASTVFAQIVRNLDAPISGVSAPNGDGDYTYQIVVIDSTGGADTVLAGVFVTVNNQAQSAQPYVDATDENGTAVFNLNAGDYVALFGAPAFAATVDSFTVTTAATDTIYTYTDAGGRVTVAFRVSDWSGTRYAGARIKIDLVSENDSILYAGDTLMGYADAFAVVDTCDAFGHVGVNLYANAAFTNDSTYYAVKILTSSGGKLYPRGTSAEYFRVPASDSVVNYQSITRWR